MAVEFVLHRNILVCVSRGYVRQWTFEFVIHQPFAYRNVIAGIGSDRIPRGTFHMEPDHRGEVTVTVAGYFEVDWKTMTLSAHRADFAVSSPETFAYNGIDHVIAKINRACKVLAVWNTYMPILVFIIQVDIQFNDRAGLKTFFERWTVGPPAGAAAAMDKQVRESLRDRFRTDDEHHFESKNYRTEFI